MKRAGANQVDEATLQLLEKINKACENFRTFSAPPQRFRVSPPPSGIVFNREVALEQMWTEKKAVLHIADIETGFNSATFLSYQSLEAVWDEFNICWEILCIGFPMKVLVDQGSALTSVCLANYAKAVGTDVQESVVGAYNSLESGEKYYAPLRRIFLEIRQEHPQMDKNVILKLPVKAMNDTVPWGLKGSFHHISCLVAYTDSTQLSLRCQHSSREWTLCKQLEVKWLLSSQNFKFEELSHHDFQEIQNSLLKLMA